MCALSTPLWRSRPHCAGGILKRSFISSVRLTVHTNPSRKWSVLRTLFKSEEFENTGFENGAFLQRRRYDNHEIFLPVVSFSNSSGVVWLKTFDAFSEWNLRFQIPPAYCGRKTSDAFSEWNLRFHILPAYCGRKTFDAFSEWNLRLQIPPAYCGLMRFQSETSVFKFLRRIVDEKHFMRFQSETSLFKFLRRIVDAT